MVISTLLKFPQRHNPAKLAEATNHQQFIFLTDYVQILVITAWTTEG